MIRLILQDKEDFFSDGAKYPLHPSAQIQIEMEEFTKSETEQVITGLTFWKSITFVFRSF